MNTPTPKSTTAIVFLIVFLDLLGVGIIAPMSPYLVERFSTSGRAVALLTLAYSAAQFLATPVLGVLSDRLGRRPILLLSLLGSAGGYVLFALADALPLLYLARVIDGITGGNIATAQAALADVTDPKNRAKVYGLVGAAFGLGFMIGPAIGAGITALTAWAMGPERAAASDLPTLAPVWASATLSMIACALVFFLLPETHPREKRRHAPIAPRDVNPLAALLDSWALPGIAMLLTVIFALGLAHAELRAVFGKYMLDRHGYTETDAGLVFAFMGFVAVAVQGGIVRKLVPLIGERSAVLLGLPFAVAGYALIPVVPRAWMVYPVIALSGAGMGLAGPALTSLVSRTAPTPKMGAAMGAQQSATSLGLVFGPILAGALYDYAGRPWPFWSAAAVLVLGFTFVLVTRIDAIAKHNAAEHQGEPAIVPTGK